MIGIVQKGTVIKPLLDYHYEKIQKGEAEILSTNIYSEEKNDQLKFYLNTFATHKNPRTKNLFMHASLSFSPKETLDSETMNRIAEEYLARMDYKDVPYTIIRHNDTVHQHIHIIASRVRFDGKLTVKSRLYKKINKEVCVSLTKKYKLIQAESQEQSKARKLQEINAQKYKVSNAILKARKEGKIQNIPEININGCTDTQLLSSLGQERFNTLRYQLEKNGYIAKSKKEILESKISRAYLHSQNINHFMANCQNDGVYIRALVKDNRKVFTYGLKESSFYLSEKSLDRKFSYTNVLNIQEKKKEATQQIHLKEYRTYLRNSVRKCLKASSSLNEFTLNLNRFNVQLQLSHTKKDGVNVIQGISFKSGDKEWLKASDIHKDLSWNNLKNQLSQTQKTTTLTESDNKKYDQVSKPQKAVQNIPDKTSKSSVNTQKLFDSKSSDTTSEEKELAKRRKRDKDMDR